MDYSRQKALFDPEKFDTPIHIIGAGATGSWVALQLAKLGCKNITVYDFDVVEEHNLPNQCFRAEIITEHNGTDWDVGEFKVGALADVVLEFTGIIIQRRTERVTKDNRFSGIVFLLTDTMSSRKEIYENCLKYKPTVKFFVETRMGLDNGRLYCINPMQPSQLSKYEQTFYSDDDAQVSACGTSQSVAPTANLIASMAVWQVIKFFNNEQFFGELLIDPRYNNLIATEY